MKKKKKPAPPEETPPVEVVDPPPPAADCEVPDRQTVLTPFPIDPVIESTSTVTGPEETAEAKTTDVVVGVPATREFPSLYDTLPTTFGAVVLGGLVVGSVQMIVRRIFEREKKEHKALTQFVTSMFALIVGIWIADKLIAGPSADLLWEQESRDVLVFIKDITLMVFAYYFGVKAQAPKDDD